MRAGANMSVFALICIHSRLNRIRAFRNTNDLNLRAARRFVSTLDFATECTEVTEKCLMPAGFFVSAFSATSVAKNEIWFRPQAGLRPPWLNHLVAAERRAGFHP
jgi:hypothetical protein